MSPANSLEGEDRAAEHVGADAPTNFTIAASEFDLEREAAVADIANVSTSNGVRQARADGKRRPGAA